MPNRTPSSPPRRSALRGAGAVVAGLLAGVALTTGVPKLLDGGDDTALALDPDLGELAVATPDLSGPARTGGAGAGATTPEAAVEGFLEAEMRRELDTSFTYLPAAQRSELGSPAGWRAAHARLLAPITGYRLGEVRTTGTRAQLAGVVDFEPGLDRIVGLTPARARVTWAAVEEAGGWAVDLESSTMEPVLPPDDTAAAAVREWAEARQDCDEDVAGEHDEGLIGVPALADALCGTGGDVRVGNVAPLPEIESSPFTAAFGGDVTTWSRQVAVEAPVALRAVIAPVGDEWTVIGVL